jgi:hypothetical protein
MAASTYKTAGGHRKSWRDFAAHQRAARQHKKKINKIVKGKLLCPEEFWKFIENFLP